MAGPSSSDPRPLSPHIQIWDWHATMYASIFNRFTGIGLYGGAFLIGAWLISLATGPEAYAVVEMVISSIAGKAILFAWTLAVLFHMLNGLRHLIWDGPGAGFSPKVASTWSLIIMALAILGAATIWSAAEFL